MFRWRAVVFGLASLAGCAADEKIVASPFIACPAVLSVVTRPQTVNLANGQSVQLTAKAIGIEPRSVGCFRSILSEQFTWKSSNDLVVRVDSLTGVATAQAEAGSALVTATNVTNHSAQGTATVLIAGVGR
jgi:hypothetical protein